jgi:carbonic anhydrase
MTKSEILQRLKTGNERFVADRLEHKLLDRTHRCALVEGQNPDVIVLSCADSRIVPEFVFDAGIGELFVVRVAGNIANKESIASIEYAVAQLGSQVIIVMGHESCGAVNAAISGGDHGENLNHLLMQIQPAIDACGSNPSITNVIKKNIELTANDLRERSKIIDNAVLKESVQIIQAYYHLETGKVEFL